MAGNRIPGSTCFYMNTGAYPLDHGTSCRQASVKPGVAVSAPPSRSLGGSSRASKQDQDPFIPSRVDYSVREKYGISEGKSSYQHGDNLDPRVPHNYLAINSLGETKLTPTQIMNLMKEDWDKFFPFGAKGRYGTNRAFVGQVFELGGPRVTLGATRTIHIPVIGDLHYPAPEVGWGNYVQVVAMTDTSVTVETMPDHTFTGQVENGIFQDSTGEMWMYQRGSGYDNEAQRVINYASAPFLWEGAAVKVRELIASTPWGTSASKLDKDGFKGGGGSSGGGGAGSKW